jgi:hypothetical protein
VVLLTEVAETAVAADLTNSGVLFAALIDDPASANDSLDAFLGQVMLETASADEVVNAGFAYASTITEAASASDVSSALVPIVGTVVETVTAASTQDSTVIAGTVLATLDGATANVTMSNGNLKATHNAAVTNSGTRSTTIKSAGKYYFEVTIGASNGAFDDVGIILSTGTYANVMSGQSCTTCYSSSSGMIWSNNSNSGRALGAAFAPGMIIQVAVDLTARKGWFRTGGTPTTPWNNQPTDDPATGVGGVTIAASGSFAPFIGFGGSPAGNVGDNFTANFGQSAYANAAPSGFGNWS